MCRPPLYSMNPSFRNLFMKKFTRDRVVPTPDLKRYSLSRLNIVSGMIRITNMITAQNPGT